MSKELNRTFAFLMLLAVAALLFGMTWSALAQNPTSDQPQATNSNKQKNAAPQVPSTARPAKQDETPTQTPPTEPTSPTQATQPAEAAPPTSDVAPNAATQTPEMQATTPAQTPRTTSRKTKRKGRMTTAETAQTTTATPSEQVDLSGTYSGVWNCPDAGVTGDSTITVNGNQFTLADGTTGRILANKTQGYTAVAIQFGEMPAATPTMGQAPATAPKIISLRARKSGSRLILSPVSGSAQCSFMPTASVAKSRRTRANKNTAAPVAAGESTGNAASVPPVVEPTAGPVPEPSTPSKSRSKSTRTANKKVNANREMNTNTGEGNANTNKNSNPVPSPTPPPNK
ncbi:MAG TPA: hypothetical protein VIV66_18230 [Pyrinomonadaceae bacterium]